MAFFETYQDVEHKVSDGHIHASKLKRKLNLYFLLIAIVAISVSAEIILEMSEGTIPAHILSNATEEYGTVLGENFVAQLKSAESLVDYDKIFYPIYDMRNRMILLLLVVTGCIVVSFFMFSRDIVSPMGNMVNAAKKLAAGDLTVKIPVDSQDEIGQVGELINEMNAKMLDMIKQIQDDIGRYREKVSSLAEFVDGLLPEEKTGDIVESRRLKLSDFTKMTKGIHKCSTSIKSMKKDLDAVEIFVNMYKTYRMGEVSDGEVLTALEEYGTDAAEIAEISRNMEQSYLEKEEKQEAKMFEQMAEAKKQKKANKKKAKSSKEDQAAKDEIKQKDAE